MEAAIDVFLDALEAFEAASDPPPWPPWPPASMRRSFMETFLFLFPFLLLFLLTLLWLTTAASILRLASLTSSLVMRSLASAETPLQPCCSGNTTSPEQMARKRRLWQLAHSASPVSQPQSGSSQRPAANGRYPLRRQYAMTPRDR